MSTRDRGDLTPFLTALIAVMLEPYNELLGRLVESGRLERSDLQALRSQLRTRMDDLTPLVEHELRKTGWTAWPAGAGAERLDAAGRVPEPR
jgi:hypothetical protein